jgi:hypothetical protein
MKPHSTVAIKQHLAKEGVPKLNAANTTTSLGTSLNSVKSHRLRKGENLKTEDIYIYIYIYIYKESVGIIRKRE